MGGIRVKLLTHPDFQYKSWIELRLIIPNDPDPNDDNQSVEITVGVRFGAGALGVRGVTCQPLPPTTQLPDILRTSPNIDSCLEGGYLNMVTLQLEDLEDKADCSLLPVNGGFARRSFGNLDPVRGRDQEG
jgi:hypothetical protein